MVHCKHGSGRSLARRGLSASLPRMPRAKEEALAIGRTVVPQGPTFKASLDVADIRGGLGPWMDPVGVVARSQTLITVAAFAILVLLPAAVAAQVTVPV